MKINRMTMKQVQDAIEINQAAGSTQSLHYKRLIQRKADLVDKLPQDQKHPSL